MKLSRQSILQEMDSGKLGFYVEAGGKEVQTERSNINSMSVNLRAGHEVGAIDTISLYEEIRKSGDAKGYDEFFAYGGVNSVLHRKELEKSLKILDLRKLGDYRLENESEDSYMVYTRDDGFLFPSRLIKDGDRYGVVVDPESFSYNHKIGWLTGLVRYQNKILQNQSQILKDVITGDIEKRDVKEIGKYLAGLTLSSWALDDIFINGMGPPPSSSFTLMWTMERVKIPNYLSGKIEGKSRLARMGLSTHPSSGKIDSGFDNKIVLELKNIGSNPIKIFPGDPLAEVEINMLDRPTDVDYGQRPDSSYKGTNVKL